MKPTTRTIKITPQMAQEFLEKNTHNRPVSDSLTKSYGEMMKAGKWVLNGEAIVFDKNGTLVDGQHRLWACFNSGRTFETVVVEGVSDEAFMTIDTGRKRTPSDVLSIDGVKRYAAAIAAAATLIIRYNKGQIYDNRVVDRQELVAFCRRSPSLEDWVAKARKGKGWHTAYAAPIAAACYLGAHKYAGKAEDFMLKFTTGEGLVRGSPVLALRNRLGTEKNMRIPDRFAFVAMAWNAHVKGRELQRMQVGRSDEFPTILGAP